MGWASGSSLMSEIIASLKPAKISHGTKIQVYEKIIEAFKDHDCDTLTECIGEDDAYDKAYRNVNPVEDGYHSAREGKKLTDNPYKRKTEEYREWELGWNDYQTENVVEDLP